MDSVNIQTEIDTIMTSPGNKSVHDPFSSRCDADDEPLQEPPSSSDYGFAMLAPKLPESLGLARYLIRHDTKSFFADRCEIIIKSWLLLLQKTTLPSNIRCTDERVSAAFHFLDDVITSGDEAYLSARLAYARLPGVLASLTDIVAIERRNRDILLSIGQRDTSIAIDIYVNTQRTARDKRAARRHVSRRVRAGKRWAALAGTSPLLLVAYSDAAERIMYVSPCSSFWRCLTSHSANFSIPIRTLNALSIELSRVSPPELVEASAYFTKVGEEAV